ncbi:MAG: type IV secretion system DNA-binding domain-containing protein [Candidatus Berkelbacteria bacterium]|nr:type IV secretion system DNA-binding domain-containing protein [Candidatus Berkelbacteria bacterium]
MRLNNLEFLDDYQKRIFIDEGYTLNIGELASIFHLPNISVETPSIVWAGAKKGEPPADLPVVTDSDPEVAVFGITDFRGSRVKFGIKEDDRRRHMYLIGRTGVGKTNTMQNMVIDDMKAGRGVAVVDPHGDFIEYILNFIPDSRINDVVLFDPSDTEHPIGFNLLENVNPELKNIVSSGLIGIFKKLWIDSWGPRLEHILRNTILALLESPGETMLGIMKMLVDENYRREVVDRVQDPVIKDFWINEFERYDQKFRTEAVAPIQNKVGQFLSSSTIRNILGQPKSMIDIEDIMDNKKILLMNLSKGKIGEDNCALIGAMLITKIQITSMMRARVPEAERVDFYLYVDEFQNFATESFAAILSEARKYHLNIIIANQYVTQMSEEVRDAVFGNVGTMITFRVGASDAPLLAKEYIPVFEETDLINLDKYHIYVKMSIDGVTTIPFSATNVPPYTEATNNHDKVIEQSRQKYGQPREIVEANIRKANVSAVEKLLREKQQQGETQKTVEELPSSPAPIAPSTLQAANAPETPSEKPAGFQEVTDTTGQRFYVLYRESAESPKGQSGGPASIPPKAEDIEAGLGGEKKKEKKETQEPKPQPQIKPEIKTKVPESAEEKPETHEEKKMKEIRKSIDTMYGEQKDEAGHTIIEEGETHEIKRDKDKEK